MTARAHALFLLIGIHALNVPTEAQDRRTRNVILVTADGLRWQEIFRGADPELAGREDAGMKDAAGVRQRFGGGSPEERRAKLTPFLWNQVAQRGTLFGNRDAGSRVTVRNRHRFSYPGYSEILTGKPQDDAVDSNDNRPNPSLTVLEIARRELDLPPEKVALFGSWEVFEGIGAHTPGAVFINAGYQAIEVRSAPERLQELSADQFVLLTPWRTVRHDYITFEMAIEYLRAVKPRLLHIALGETDDWAHEKRYDRYLETAHYFDQCLAKLWDTLDRDPDYRGRTTLLVAVDHGRGSTPEDWHSHGEKIDGAQHVWLAALGPDTAAIGEAKSGPALTQSDIAPTILDLLGLNWRALEGAQGAPVKAITGDTQPRPAR